MNIETNSRIRKELDSTAVKLLTAQSAVAHLLLTIVQEGNVDILSKKGAPSKHGGPSLAGKINEQVVVSLAKRGVNIQRTRVSQIWSDHISPIVSIKGPKDDQHMEYDGKKADALHKTIISGKFKSIKKEKQPAQRHDLTAVDVIEMFKKLPKKEQAKALKAIALI